MIIVMRTISERGDQTSIDISNHFGEAEDSIRHWKYQPFLTPSGEVISGRSESMEIPDSDKQRKQTQRPDRTNRDTLGCM